MAYRTAHGSGADALARVETLPAAEQPPAQAAGADPLAAGRDPVTKRLRTTEAARALAKLPRRSRHLPRAIVCSPGFEPHNRRRLEWQSKRMAELQAAHGGVSHGVGAIINAAAWLHAGGEFAAEQAAATGNVELFKTAASLTGQARQHELTAWELCSREAVARPVESPRERIMREAAQLREAEGASE